MSCNTTLLGENVVSHGTSRLASVFDEQLRVPWNLAFKCRVARLSSVPSSSASKPVLHGIFLFQHDIGRVAPPCACFG